MVLHSKLYPFVGLPLTLSLVVACSPKSDSDEDGKQGGTVTTVAIPNQLSIEGESLGLIRNAKRMGIKNFQLPSALQSGGGPAAAFGHSLADGIKSLKYRISGMNLCGEIAVGRGDSCGARPFPIYNENRDTANYDEFVPSSDAAASFDQWTDFMKKGSIEELVGKVTYSEGNVGAYQAVIVNFYRTFKVDATVQLNNDEQLFTKNVDEFFSNGKSGLDVTYAGKNESMTAGPSEEGLFFLPNGGKTFLLQRPFEITAADVENLVPYKMALAFDPVNFVKGSAFSPGAYAGGAAGDYLEGQVDDAKGYAILPGFLEFAPILARESETIMKETYVLSTNGIEGVGGSLGEQPFSARMTFYYVKEDPTKAVRGVTTVSYYNEYSTSYLNYNPLGGIGAVRDGTVEGTVSVYQGLGGVIPLFKDFKRLSAVEETGEVEGEVCAGGFTSAGCSETTKKVTWFYTFVGSAEAETELKFEAVPPPPPPSAPAP
jgi:hypothetical protein